MEAPVAKWDGERCLPCEEVLKAAGRQVKSSRVEVKRAALTVALADTAAIERARKWNLAEPVPLPPKEPEPILLQPGAKEWKGAGAAGR